MTSAYRDSEGSVNDTIEHSHFSRASIHCYSNFVARSISTAMTDRVQIRDRCRTNVNSIQFDGRFESSGRS